MIDEKDLGELYITSTGKLARFDYLPGELDEYTFREKVLHQDTFAYDEMIFEIDINCIWVMDYIENHPLFPMIVWDEHDIMFGFNPRFISGKLGW